MAYKKHEHYSLVIRFSVKHVPLLQLLQWSYLYWGQVLRRWQRGAAGIACEERLGLSWAGYSCFQLFPMDPPQGTGEPSSQDGVSSGKTYLRKGRRHGRKEEGEKVRNSRGNAKIREGRGGGPPCPIPCSPWRSTGWSSRKVWEERRGREKPLCIDHSPPRCPLFCATHCLTAETQRDLRWWQEWEERSWDWRSEAEPGNGGRSCVGLVLGFLFPATWISD